MHAENVLCEWLNEKKNDDIKGKTFYFLLILENIILIIGASWNNMAYPESK